MKIVDKIAQKSAERKPFYSFEYFPPKTTQVQQGSALFSTREYFSLRKLLAFHTIFTSGLSYFSPYRSFSFFLSLSFRRVLPV